jgi:beta-phosphoglucomutase
MSLRKEALYREIVRASGIEPLPGVTAWLAELKAAAIPCAIASSTHRLNIEIVLEVIGLTSSFSAIVSAEDVTHGKPDPQVFLRAAERLQFEPQHCVVFEDAHVGIEAAHAANMRVIAVATTHPQGELRAADMAVERLDELSVAAVVRLLG